MTTPDTFADPQALAQQHAVEQAFRDVLGHGAAPAAPRTPLPPTQGGNTPHPFASGADASIYEPVWSRHPVSQNKVEERPPLWEEPATSPFFSGTFALPRTTTPPAPAPAIAEAPHHSVPYFLRHAKSAANAAPQHAPHPALGGYDVARIQADFPILHQKVNGHKLIWLDNAATTQKPRAVIDATSAFYEQDNSNIHRAAHTLAARATDAFEGARTKLQHFIGAREAAEIVFVRGTTEAINLVAQSYGRANIGPGDEILITTIEHHANIVPWQLLARQTGAVLKVAPVNDRGELLLEHFAALLSGRTKLVSVTHVANALGTINPVEQIIALSHAAGVPVLVDAAQSSPHLPLNVAALDADFLVLSGHKIYGPTGIGILYGKRHLLEAMPPWQGGGHMIRDVTFAHTEFQGLPEKFEAGTPDIAGAVGLGAAVDYLQGIGLPAIAAHEHALLEYATQQFEHLPGVHIIGTAQAKASVLSFIVDGHSVGDVAKHLDRHGIAARSGHHCAQPALRRFGIEATVRASFGLYNSFEDVDTLITSLRQLVRSA
ncbi:MAG: cysteine desulfurase [Acetobacter sp.]|uniref:cysteine desulfurase n=1 Tax=Acetobacter lovaniensis TaxID=104100 RepID=A0A841QIC0_9PROT|nr:cysteine desulfurase [Acetobacter lovaniensis]MBB6457752.1 cysteine desulfurase/selenocysteine lyase [Acetobacter lovaniensis]MCI1698602.1 cysteine desulfurase [Acetobacter lovaniensis]MCI1796461.1 cysteine desulfurase [Acetobacter lovaniensis]MCP1239908.1 cysteine desulfurase [Acetobacter lovaniensis]NHN82009.1 SufS family cysteine desulfurase [Acetobacter lovaniensis]